ncbi:MAG: hypothetical protein K0R82_2545 [Flavipsychrobacter sp.]|nr:hypothetical protein [Flavipsychrobacter sp.]
MKKLSLTWPLALLFLVVSFLGACAKDEDDPVPNNTTVDPPWEEIVEASNFFINSTSIVMHDNEFRDDLYNAYILPSAMPDEDYETYTISILAASDPAYTIELSNIVAKVISGPNMTDNMLVSSTYTDETEVRDKAYARYRLDLRDNQRIANAETFHKLFCDLTITYKDAKTKKVMSTRDVTVEVFPKP